jgi:hypothetical protein
MRAAHHNYFEHKSCTPGPPDHETCTPLFVVSYFGLFAVDLTHCASVMCLVGPCINHMKEMERTAGVLIWWGEDNGIVGLHQQTLQYCCYSFDTRPNVIKEYTRYSDQKKAILIMHCFGQIVNTKW